MITLGATGLATSVTPANPVDSANSVTSAVSSAPVAPAAPPVPARIVPVGGLIENGNFVASAGGWQGDGIPDPSGKGLVVKLSPSSWTRVYQSFAGSQGTQHSIEVTYKLSPGFTISMDPADYTNINARLQISGFENFRSEVIPPGNLFGILGDPTGTSICCEFFAPRLGSTDVQDYQHTYPPIPAFGNKVFALAFPPGTGTVTLLTAYVTSH